MWVQMKTRVYCQCGLHVSLLLQLSHWLQRASKLPRDQRPFLEMLLNHHNPPKVFEFKVLLVSPHQLHSWQLATVEPNLFKGGAQLRSLHGLWGGLLKISRYKGFCFTLNWPFYHFSLTSIRMLQTSIVIHTLLRKAVFFFDILKWLPGLKRPFNIGGDVEGLLGKWHMASRSGSLAHQLTLLMLHINFVIRAGESQFLQMQLMSCHTT